MAKKEKKSSSGMDIPDYAIEAIARSLLPTIQKYYESEDGQKAYAEWKVRREKDKGKE